MHVPGKRIRRTRLVQSERFIVAVDVEAVIPDGEPSEPCYESETIELLREVGRRAQLGDRDWLVKQGRVYERVRAA